MNNYLTWRYTASPRDFITWFQTKYPSHSSRKMYFRSLKKRVPAKTLRELCAGKGGWSSYA